VGPCPGIHVNARSSVYAVRSRERVWERLSGPGRQFLASLKRAGPAGPARGAPAYRPHAAALRGYPERGTPNRKWMRS